MFSLRSSLLTTRALIVYLVGYFAFDCCFSRLNQRQLTIKVLHSLANIIYDRFQETGQEANQRSLTPARNLAVPRKNASLLAIPFYNTQFITQYFRGMLRDEALEFNLL